MKLNLLTDVFISIFALYVNKCKLKNGTKIFPTFPNKENLLLDKAPEIKRTKTQWQKVQQPASFNILKYCTLDLLNAKEVKLNLHFAHAHASRKLSAGVELLGITPGRVLICDGGRNRRRTVNLD